METQYKLHDSNILDLTVWQTSHSPSFQFLSVSASAPPILQVIMCLITDCSPSAVVYYVCQYPVNLIQKGHSLMCTPTGWKARVSNKVAVERTGCQKRQLWEEVSPFNYAELKRQYRQKSHDSIFRESGCLCRLDWPRKAAL